MEESSQRYRKNYPVRLANEISVSIPPSHQSEIKVPLSHKLLPRHEIPVVLVIHVAIVAEPERLLIIYFLSLSNHIK